MLFGKGVEYMDDWEKSVKHHYLREEIFTVTLTWKILLIQISGMQKEFVKFWNKEFRQIIWFACSKWYIIASWCVWEHLEYMNLILLDFFLHQDYGKQSNFKKDKSKIRWTWSCLISFCIKTLASSPALKKTKVKLDLLTDIDILVMLEKFIRGGICYAIHQYAKASNKYMKDCYLKVIWSGLEVHRNLVKVS